MFLEPNRQQIHENCSRKCFIPSDSRGHNERCAAARKWLGVTCKLHIDTKIRSRDLALCLNSLFSLWLNLLVLLLVFWCWWEFSSLFTRLHHVIISVYPWKLSPERTNLRAAVANTWTLESHQIPETESVTWSRKALLLHLHQSILLDKSILLHCCFFPSPISILLLPQQGKWCLKSIQWFQLTNVGITPANIGFNSLTMESDK